MKHETQTHKVLNSLVEQSRLLSTFLSNSQLFAFHQMKFCQQTYERSTFHHFSQCHQNANFCANANAMPNLK